MWIVRFLGKALPIVLASAVVIVFLLTPAIHQTPEVSLPPESPAEDHDLPTQPKLLGGPIGLPVSSLEDWYALSVADSGTVPPSAMEEGLRLADSRAKRLRAIIRKDPGAAIQAMLPLSFYAELPPEIRGRIEQPFSDTGDITVIARCLNQRDLTAPGEDYYATWGGVTRQVFLPESRQGLTSKRKVSLAGVMLGNTAALRESPVWVLSETEAQVASEVLGISELEAGGDSDSVHLLVGNELKEVSPAEQRQHTELLRLAETLSGSETMVAATAVLAAGGDTNHDASQAITAASAAWTQAPKDVLMIRVQFPDVALTISQADVEAVLSETSDRLSEHSYGQTFLRTKDVSSAVYTLPHNSAYYLGLTDDAGEPNGYLDIRTDAISVARSAGLDTDGYQIRGVLFAPIAVGFGGRASVGGGPFGGRLWINGNVNPSNYLHEFGHLYGLQHASAWNANDGSSVPCPVEEEDLSLDVSEHDEYGDLFDVMGNGSSVAEFSAFGKGRLGWISNDKVLTLTESGESSHRLYRFDHSGALANETLALKVQRAQSETYWISFRAGATSGAQDDPMRSSANVLWQFASDRARLVDTTPDSTSNYFFDRVDAGVAVGDTFTDAKGLVTISPTAIGGTGASQWMDVNVTLGAPGNLPPMGTISGPAEGVARTPYTFTVSATDSDNDPISYRWHLGNGIVIEGGTTIEHTFPLAVSEIQVELDDGRGGVTFLTHQISMAEDPLLNLEHVRTDEDLEEIAYGNGRFIAVGDEIIMESIDGEEWEEFSTDVDWKCVAFGDHTFLVGGRQDDSEGDGYAAILSSQDGRVWVAEPVPQGPIHSSVTSLAYGNGIWLAAATRDNGYRRVGDSPWEMIDIPSESLIFGEGAFYAQGGSSLFRSVDGVTWTDISPSNVVEVGFIRGLAFLEGHLYGAASNGTWRVEENTSPWTNSPFSDPDLWLETTFMIMEAPGILFASGRRSQSSEVREEYYVSVDGVLWGEATHELPRWDWKDGTYGFGRIITVTQRQIVASGFLDTDNQPPEASFTASASGAEGIPVALSLTENDPDGDELYHLWDFGDGSEAWGGSEMTHVYANEGDYDAEVQVTDGRGGLIKVEGIVAIASLPSSEDNADGDDWPDLIEYVTGSSSLSGQSTPVLATAVVRENEQDWVEFIIPRRDPATGSTIIPEVSKDMVDWQSGSEVFTARDSGPGELIVRDLTPFTGLEHRFYRIRVVVP